MVEAARKARQAVLSKRARNGKSRLTVLVDRVTSAKIQEKAIEVAPWACFNSTSEMNGSHYT